MVPLLDSLSHFPKPLLRLVKALERTGGLANLQVSADTSAALIAQTGAEDSASVRLEIKENRKLRPEEIAEVVTRYQAGASIQSLGRAFGLHPHTVRTHLRRSGIKIRPVLALTPTQETEAIRLYLDEQWTLDEVGQRFDVSQTAIRKLLIRRGIPRRTAARRRLR